MPSPVDRIEFLPPPQRGHLRALALAIVAHALLVAALSVGLHWKRDSEDAAVEAELWSTTVQQAAPRLVETPPPPQPPPPTTARVQQQAPTPQVKDAAIAIERDRKQREVEKKAQEQRELQKKQQAEKAAREKKAAADKAAADKRKADDRREDQQAKAAEEKRRLDNIRRMQGLAGATGAPDATGNAQRSSGPSASYGARLAGLFKRNITFADPETINGNPKAVVEVRVGPSGLIMSSNLVKKSGVQAWDDAVLRAVQKTERIPADENGRYPSVFPIEFGPKDN